MSEGGDAGRVAHLAELTARAARLWPDRPGLIFDETGRSLTFGEVERAANRIANALAATGIGAGDRVAVMMRNRPEFPLSWLAIARLGASMVPLNVFYRTADAGYLLAHSEARAIVTTDEFVPLVDGLRGPDLPLESVLSVDGDGGGRAVDFRPAIAAAADTAPAGPPPSPESLANIQYTSGTTGHPKGCMLSHAYWLNIARKASGIGPGLDEGDRMLIAQPYYYMDPQWMTATALLTGAPLVVLDRFHPASFREKVREHGVTFFYCLGVMPAMLLNLPPGPEDRDHRLRFVVCSGIPPSRHAEIEERWGVPWFEAFGMTETGIDVAMTVEDHDETVGTGCIGRAVEGREVRIVDDEGRPVPPGEVGEMLLRGGPMMTGYYRDEEATRRAFAGGWMHTGDLCRMDEAGRVYYLGRKKHMIRRSGENISAAEVEEVLVGLPEVALAAVVPVPDDLRGEEIKAYVVLDGGRSPDEVPPERLAAACAERLAYFKVPRYWAFREDLPRTPSERVRKEVLLAEDGDDPLAGCWDRAAGEWR